jgi:mono/diheme cytochrome c family protein
MLPEIKLITRPLLLMFGAVLGVILIANSSPASETKPKPVIFVRKHCIQCHAIAAFDLKGSSTAPDLSTSAAVVKKRYGLSLAAFLEAPEGPMKDVLSSMIHLTPQERASMAELLTTAPKHLKKSSKATK